MGAPSQVRGSGQRTRQVAWRWAPGMVYGRRSCPWEGRWPGWASCSSRPLGEAGWAVGWVGRVEVAPNFTEQRGVRAAWVGPSVVVRWIRLVVQQPGSS